MTIVISLGWALPQRFLRLPARPWRRVALALVLASSAPQAGTAASSSGQPPWWVRALATAERRFSLTSEVFSERQESLRIAAFDQFLETVDPQTGEVHTFRLPGDPALLNRKFDLRFERQGAGPGVAVALPTGGFVYPTLSFDAALADVSLDFHDITEPQDSTSLHGRGALFDARLDLVATPCKRCPLFTVTSYRFEKLPSFDVDRSPRFALEGFSVTGDRARLGRDVHEVSSLLGYAPADSRVTSFVGVQHRWTDLDIDDRLAYRNAFSNDRLSSRTRLESEATLAVARLDVDFGSQWSGRLESAVGDGDWSAWLGIAFQPSSRGDLKSRIRLAWLAQEVGRLHAEFTQEAADLPEIGWRAAAERLFDRYEQRLRDVLPASEFAGLRSLVRSRFDRARNLLARVASQQEVTPGTDGVHVGYVPASLALATESVSLSKDESDALREADGLFEQVAHLIGVGDLEVFLCFLPRDSKTVRVLLVPADYLADHKGTAATALLAEGAATINARDCKVVDRGVFGYFTGQDLDPKHYDLTCAGAAECAVDIAKDKYPYVCCDTARCDVFIRRPKSCALTP